ncbi:MAG TPA: cyclopropane-fatty-acyl-phospholipid synthase family protein, partial [Candidatus Kapabacteria bacterium]|nr:cyclopropane-fatty-acyl-phospholipid synthase family protein [Candidatus Kapabacteria bacterium]
MDRTTESKKLTAAPGARRYWPVHLLQRVFRDYPGSMAVRLWDGNTLEFGTDAPRFTLNFRHPRVFRDLVLFRDPLRLAEAYIRGKVDLDGDLYSALALRNYLQAVCLTVAERAAFLARAALMSGVPRSNRDFREPAGSRAIRARLSPRHSRAVNRQAIAFHYDVSNDFYRLWLDEQMVYSCAYFEAADDSLDQAQRNKLGHICRKLRLKPGERLLDIGCGWGALIRWAATHYGVSAHGITLSRGQYEHCQQRIAAEGLRDRVSVELVDYRDLPGEAVFDKIVSVGMFEHVGVKNYPIYFGAVRRLLKPGGLFLNHGITQETEGWDRK